MADQADVETALTAAVANALYPNGTASPSVLDMPCRVYRGFPAAPALEADLRQGAVHVSITANGNVKNLSRYPRRWVGVMPVAASLIATAAPQSVTFSGTCAVGQLAGIAVNDLLFVYAVQNNDTPPTVASNLAAMMRDGGVLVAYSATTVSVPGAAQFSARVVEGAGALQEIKRQSQDFKVSLWCPDPASRDAAAALIDETLAGQNFLPLADGAFARLIYAGTETSDMAADAIMYRRDLTYSAEYPTTLAQIMPAMLFGTARIASEGILIENRSV